MEWGSKLAKKNISRVFTIELTEAWSLYFGGRPVTPADLLDDGGTMYLLLRAAGVAEPMFGRSAAELKRVRAWFDYFDHNPLPTRDGLDDARIEQVEHEYQTAWILRMPERRVMAMTHEERHVW